MRYSIEVNTRTTVERIGADPDEPSLYYWSKLTHLAKEHAEEDSREVHFSDSRVYAVKTVIQTCPV